MKIKYLFIILLSTLEVYCNAQNNANSPYTMFGIGYIEPGGFGRNKALGGAGIALPSDISLNNMNPASYHSLDSLHFLLETGVNSIYSKFTNHSQQQENLNANFSYLAMGFRITKRWANSFGIAPYSNVGYSIDVLKQIEGSSEYSRVNVEGAGGLNQIYWGNSFKFNKNFSLGINASYLFGTISQTEKTTNDYFGGSIKVEDESRLKNFYFNYGAQYSFKINSNLDGMIGAVYGDNTKLGLKHNINIIDNTNDTLKTDVYKNSNFYIPQYFGAGFSVNFKKQLLITGDYTQSNWSGSNKSASGVEFVNSHNIMMGIEFIPSVKPSATYMQVLRYRLGGYTENSYMKINGQQLRDYGITAGIGLPIMRGKTYINVAFAVGKKGVQGSGSIINENYYKLSINFSLFDFWFARSKFD